MMHGARGASAILNCTAPEITDGMEDFYKTAADLYADGVLGGLRIRATRP